MAKSREELDALIEKHEKGELDQGNEDVLGEIIYIIKFLIFYIVATFVIVTTLASLISLITGGFDLDLVILFGEMISGYALIPLALLFAISYYAGMGAFTGGMMVKAWTNSSNIDANHMFKDMQRLMSGGQIIRGLFIGNIVTFVLYYIVF